MKNKDVNIMIEIGKELQEIQNRLTKVTVKIGANVNKKEMHKFDPVTQKLVKLRSDLQETVCKEFIGTEDQYTIADAFF